MRVVYDGGASLSEDTKQALDVTQRLYWRILSRIVKIIDEKYGQEGLTAIHDGIRDWDLWTDLLTKSGLVQGQANPQDLFEKVVIPGEKALMLTKCEVTGGPDRVFDRVSYCNIAKAALSESAKTCGVIARGIDWGLAKAGNPNIKVSGDKHLGAGDDWCEACFEMTKPSSQESRKK